MNLFRQSYLHIRNFPVVFWVVLGATLMNQIGNMAFVFLVLYLNQHLGFTITQASLAFAAVSAGMLIVGMIAGNFIDQFGAARLIPLTLLANGLILLFFPLIHHYVPILLMCFVWGSVYGLYRPASQAFISTLSTPGLHKLTFSLYRLVVNLGMSMGPAIGGYLSYHSFAAIFIANGSANLLASLMLVIGLYGSTWFTPQQPFHKPQLFLTFKWLRKDKWLLLFFIAMIPVSMIFFQHESTLAIFLKSDLNFPLSFYGWLFTINTLMIVFFELPLNILTLNWPYRINFMLGSFLITAGFAGLFFATLAWHIILLTIIWTLGEMVLYPSTSSYIADIAPVEHRGSYLALSNTCSNLGMLLGPWAGAIVMEHKGPHGLWLSCGLWGMISIILFYFLRDPERKLEPH